MVHALPNITYRVDAEIMALSVLAAGDAAAFLSGVNPSLFTIRTFSGDWAGTDETAGDIRKGMILGNALALAVGGAATVVSESWWPLIFTMGAAIVLDMAYEWALRCPRGNGGS